ncbi:MAG: hypothetical protein Q9159_002651 [Coniocarpon cinnabarinum]
MQLLYVSETLFVPLSLFIKLTLLVFYHKVFYPKRAIRWLSRAGILIITGFHVSIFWASVFLCIPVQKAYDFTRSGHCLPKAGTPYASGIFNVVSDIFILVLPMPAVWSLHMSFARKLKLTSVFGAGILFIQSAEKINSMDVTWDYALLSLFGLFEVDVGIMCACATALPAFFDDFLKQYTTPVYEATLKYMSSFSKSTKSLRGPLSESSRNLTHGTPAGTTVLVSEHSGPPRQESHSNKHPYEPYPNEDNVGLKDGLPDNCIRRQIDLEQTFEMAPMPVRGGHAA